VYLEYSAPRGQPSEECVCYMFGLPLNVTGNDINSEFSKRDIHKPIKVEKIDKSKSNINNI
jgi:hypothetical protein